jgi:hypothetical protein
MTREGAHATATMLMAGAAGGLAFLLFRNPRLRRAVGRVIWTGLTTSLPGIVIAETRNAWTMSGHRP